MTLNKWSWTQKSDCMAYRLSLNRQNAAESGLLCLYGYDTTMYATLYLVGYLAQEATFSGHRIYVCIYIYVYVRNAVFVGTALSWAWAWAWAWGARTDMWMHVGR